MNNIRRNTTVATTTTAPVTGGRPAMIIKNLSHLPMRSESHNYEQEKAAKLINLGKSRFIKKHGLMRFGLPLSIVLIINSLIYTHFDIGISDNFLTKILILVVVTSLGGLIGGWLFGTFMWNRLNASYKELQQQS